jgi:hypothetical protein
MRISFVFLSSYSHLIMGYSFIFWGVVWVITHNRNTQPVLVLVIGELSDCWEGTLERLEDVERAARREAYIVQKRSHDRKEVQDLLQQRLQQSLMDRG